MAGSRRRGPVSIGVTLSEPEFTTYPIRRSGASALACGCRPTVIGRPAWRFTSPTGVTVPACELTTNAVAGPSGGAGFGVARVGDEDGAGGVGAAAAGWGD